MADNPFGYWRLGETTGTVAFDETVNDSRGVYKNGVALNIPSAIPTDPLNGAAGFDGGNDRVEWPDSPVLDVGTSDFTMEGWVKTTVSPIDTERGIMSKRDPSKYWLLNVTDDSGHKGQLRAIVFDGVSTRSAYSLHLVDDGNWHHFAVRVDRDAGISFYVDGVYSGLTNGTTPGDLDNTGLYWVGKSSGYTEFKGELDDIALYKSLLAPERIQAHYYASISDEVAPIVTLTSPANGGTTADTTPAFSGSSGVELGDSTTVTVKVYEGAGTGGTLLQELEATREADGAYTVDASAPLAFGTYTVRASQSDGAGNVGTSSANTFTIVDGPAPPPPPPPPPANPVLVGAGDIASCGVSGQDEATAAIIEGLPNASVFTLGDNAYPMGRAEDYACYDATWGRFKNRTRPVVGGHDYQDPSGAAAVYYNYFGAAAGDPTKGYYSYDLGDWHVVVLNSACDHTDNCGPGSVQDTWLRDDLAANSSVCTLALFHDNLYSSGDVHGNNADMRSFWEALYENGADLVLNGNEHLYERFLPQDPYGGLDLTYGISQITVGTGGYLPYGFREPQPNSAVRFNDAHGVMKLTLRPSGYDWRFLPIIGRTSTDTGSAECHGKPINQPPPPPPPTGLAGGLPAALPASTGATFYVSPTGSDANPGTLSQPWLTVQKALDTLTAGQRALVRAGTYNANLTLNRAGTAAAPITVEAYPGERAVLASAGSHPFRAESAAAYFRLRGFVIQGYPLATGGSVDLHGQHLEISNNEITGSTNHAIYTDEPSHHIHLLGNRIHHNGQGLAEQSHGIYLQGNDHLVANNVIHDHPEGFGIQVYDRGSRAMVVGNTVTHSSASGIVVGGAGGVDNVRIQNNVLAFNGGFGVGTDTACPTASIADHNVAFAQRPRRLRDRLPGPRPLRRQPRDRPALRQRHRARPAPAGRKPRHRLRRPPVLARHRPGRRRAHVRRRAGRRCVRVHG